MKIKSILLGLILGLTLYAGVPEEEVLILTKSEVIRMPEGKIIATLAEIEAPPELLETLSLIQTIEVKFQRE